MENEEEANKVAADFSRFGLDVNNGNSSIFMNRCVEIMKSRFLGTNGHIAFRCYDIERTLYFLKNNGFTVNEDTVKYDAKGKIKVAYLNEEIGGFAVHLVK